MMIISKTEFNKTIRIRWPELYWADGIQYKDSPNFGNINLQKLMVFINYAQPNIAKRLTHSSDEIYEATLINIVEYIEENESMIDFWLL